MYCEDGVYTDNEDAHVHMKHAYLSIHVENLVVRDDAGIAKVVNAAHALGGHVDSDRQHLIKLY
jgi:hypothetical protein